jgi:hypothetical protein
MFRKLRVVFLCMCVVFAVSCAGIKPRQYTSTALVVPAKYTIVQLAFNVARMRPVSLVSYDRGEDAASPVMHVWNSSGCGSWVRITVEEYGEGNIFPVQPQRIMLVGDDDDLPSVIMDASSWAEPVRIPTVSIVDLINTLDTSFDFTPREWKFLAKEHGLKLKDHNKDLRRYGKYGKPGTEKRPKMPELIQEEMSNDKPDLPDKIPQPLPPGPVKDVSPEDK